MDLKCELFDTSKKGTIIFSHYRSGGTQLKLIVRNTLIQHFQIPCKDSGELEFDLENQITPQQFYDKINFKSWKNHHDGQKFDDDSYGVILINNPFTIQWIRNNPKELKYIKENYCLVGVRRKNILKSLLSLPLWTRLIDAGLYENYDLWTNDNLQKFHDDTLSNPIRPFEIYLGYFSVFENIEKSTTEYLNHIVRHLLDEFTILKLFCQELNCNLLNYEDYEFDKKYLLQYLPNELNLKSELVEELGVGVFEPIISKIVNATYRGKIPYVSDDYSVYVNEEVNNVLKGWGLLDD
mgnify:FL=1|jgi:hypothetical protein